MCLTGQEELCKLLIKAGADVRHKDVVGKTPLEYAREHHGDKMADSLLLSTGMSYCVLGCGKLLLPSEVDDHERGLCNFALVACPACGDLMTAKEYREQHEGSCGQEMMLCIHCNTRIKVCNLVEHELECIQRAQRICDACDQIIPLREFEDHVEKFCPERFGACPRCGIKMLHKNLETHFHLACPHFELPCELCGLKFPRVTLKKHVLHECSKRPMKCRFGCTIPMDIKREHDLSHISDETNFYEWSVAEMAFWVIEKLSTAIHFNSTIVQFRFTEVLKKLKMNGTAVVNLYRKPLINDLHKEGVPYLICIEFADIIATKSFPCPHNCGKTLSVPEWKNHDEALCNTKLFECKWCKQKMQRDVFEEHQVVCVESPCYCERCGMRMIGINDKVSE